MPAFDEGGTGATGREASYSFEHEERRRRRRRSAAALREMGAAEVCIKVDVDVEDGNVDEHGDDLQDDNGNGDHDHLPQSSEERMDEELELAVEDLLSFSGTEHLLRSAPLSILLKGVGKIFSNSRGTEDTYALSRPTSTIGYFISHNWAVSRAIKFAALAFKFNLDDAFIAAVFVIALCIVLSLLGWQPTLEQKGASFPAHVGCRLALPITVIFVLLFGRMCHRGGAGPSVFLDKVCIHQTDPSLQSAGIRKLGAFIRASDRMLVLYTSVYLKRLWTVYEVAGFLALHDVHQLELVPAMLPLAYIIVLFGQFGYQWLLMSVDLVGLPGLVVTISQLCGSGSYYVALRMWAKSRASIQTTLANFSVRHAECAVESDRQVVHSNIVSLMRASGKAKRQTPEAEVLEAFDNEVRKNVAFQFNRVFGKFAFSAKEYYLVAILSAAPGFVDLFTAHSREAPLREVVSEHCLDIFWIFTILPTMILGTEAFASAFLTAKLPCEILWSVFGVGTITAYGNLFIWLMELASERVLTDDALLIVLLIGQVFSSGLIMYFLPRVCSPHRQRVAKINGKTPIQKNNGPVLAGKVRSGRTLSGETSGGPSIEPDSQSSHAKSSRTASWTSNADPAFTSDRLKRCSGSKEAQISTFDLDFNNVSEEDPLTDKLCTQAFAVKTSI